MFAKIGREISFRDSGQQLLYVAFESDPTRNYYFDLASMKFYQNLQQLDQPADLPEETILAFLGEINNEDFLNNLRRVIMYSGRSANRPLKTAELDDLKARIAARLSESPAQS